MDENIIRMIMDNTILITIVNIFILDRIIMDNIRL